MLPYYISQSNVYTFRTENTSALDTTITMSLTDMMGLNTFTGSMTDTQFTTYENILSFTGSISGAYVGSEYRVRILNDNNSIWDGTIQVFTSQSEDKAVYENKNNQYISNTSENKYVIYE